MASYDVVVLADSPVVYHRLNDTSGTNCKDSSGHGRDGTYQANPTLNQPGPVPTGKSVKFTAASSQYVAGAAATLLTNPNILTAEAWFNMSNGGAGPFAIMADIISNFGVEIRVESGKIVVLKAFTGPILTSAATYNDSNWHHVVYTKNLTVSKLYMDGQDVTPTVTDQTLVAGGGLRVGALTNAAEFYDGSIAEVAYYDGVLSPSQVTAHFNARNGSNRHKAFSIYPSLVPSLAPSIK